MTFRKLMAQPVDARDVERVVGAELQRILENVAPSRVYLFGSASRGEMTDASDLDFLIVVPDDAPLRELKSRYYRSPGPRVTPVDAVFVTESEFRTRSGVGGVCMVCAQEGRLLHPNPEGAA